MSSRVFFGFAWPHGCQVRPFQDSTDTAVRDCSQVTTERTQRRARGDSTDKEHESTVSTHNHTCRNLEADVSSFAPLGKKQRE